MPFFLFILLNVVLFLRPAEIVPQLQGLPLYLCVILGCIAVSFKSLVSQLRSNSLLCQPLSFSVLGLLFAVILSHLSHIRIGMAFDSGFAFWKLVIYYFLAVGVLDSPMAYRRFLRCLILLIVTLVGLALMQYHELIDVAELEVLQQRVFDENGEVSYLGRLCGPGIFHDPNDLSLIIVLGCLICLFSFDVASAGLRRYLWIIPIPYFLYALSLTHSRGGLLTFLAGILTYLVTRFGGRKALTLSLLLAPLGLFLFSGRQTNITLESGTGQDRVQLWSEGMILFWGSPIFGIGMDQYEEHVGHVAHNSFVHTYTELGFIGGTLFLMIFLCGYRDLIAMGRSPKVIANIEVNRLRCFLLASFTAFLFGFWSLSRAYSLPSYLLFSLVAAYVVITARRLNVPTMKITREGLMRCAAMSLGAFLFINLFIRCTVRW